MRPFLFLLSTLQHTDPDYSAAYVVLDTDCGLKGFGLTFTLGKGTEIGKICTGVANPRAAVTNRPRHTGCGVQVLTVSSGFVLFLKQISEFYQNVFGKEKKSQLFTLNTKILLFY